ncbi:hypothetical protein [Desertivirga brevis]|uniref:hypothetical protein n=1 Tax=Desertivirga brevis TaxID=2810310 RepID=UPI001A9576A2|nr:hypothetical protein [Pedobacter sp. SYSU D00873]
MEFVFVYDINELVIKLKETEKDGSQRVHFIVRFGGQATFQFDIRGKHLST